MINFNDVFEDSLLQGIVERRPFLSPTKGNRWCGLLSRGVRFIRLHVIRDMARWPNLVFAGCKLKMQWIELMVRRGSLRPVEIVMLEKRNVVDVSVFQTNGPQRDKPGRKSQSVEIRCLCISILYGKSRYLIRWFAINAILTMKTGILMRKPRKKSPNPTQSEARSKQDDGQTRKQNAYKWTMRNHQAVILAGPTLEHCLEHSGKT